MSITTDLITGIPQWLLSFDDHARKERIWSLGLLSGWRRFKESNYGAANFERALVLDRLVETLKPVNILEIGTGRGLGALTVATASREYGLDVKITTIDALAPDVKQKWPIQIDGENKVINSSLNEVWSQYVDKTLTNNITKITALSTKALPELSALNKKYDLIFIDGGHDLHSVINDLSYSISMLNSNGVILMDDFAPLDEYGFGTCMATYVAGNWIENIKVFPSEGLVYGAAEHSEYPRGMVLLWGQKRKKPYKIYHAKLFFWKMLERLIWLAMKRGIFPLR
ncbi:MAG TPA: class I SAM-dependent methyltransferase [Nitrospirae bacterium]|nr:class I SAM-dependent methyltransferase [Nitrospirota bacterium]